MIRLTADDILESEAWRNAVNEANKQLWSEFCRADADDIKALQKIRLCKWALDRMEAHLQEQMRHKLSINLKSLK